MGKGRDRDQRWLKISFEEEGSEELTPGRRRITSKGNIAISKGSCATMTVYLSFLSSEYVTALLKSQETDGAEVHTVCSKAPHSTPDFHAQLADNRRASCQHIKQGRPSSGKAGRIKPGSVMLEKIRNGMEREVLPNMMG